MKRDGYIIEEITERSNLEDSFDTVVHGTLRKSLREGKWLLAHRKEFLDKLGEEITKGDIKLKGFHSRLIRDGSKTRNIQIFCMADRIKINAVMSIVDKHLKRRFIRTTSSSIKGRGMHDLKEYIERDIKADPNGTKYVYKFDVHKFYESVNQEFVIYAIKRTFKDKKLIEILGSFVHTLPTGMSMGMRASQGLCNLMLSIYLDHYLKDRYGIKHFYRYCDDGVILSGSKKELWIVRDIVNDIAKGINLEIKSNERVFPITEGIDFLGYVIYPNHSLLRKRIKQNYARKMQRIKSRKRRIDLVGSLYGMAKHANCVNLLNTLLTNKEMKRFSEMGVIYTPADGKKRFQGKAVRLGSIVNNKIEVYDYEKDVKTSQGEHRYLVSFRDVQTNEFGKFFTNSDELKCILDRILDMEDGFPFETVIRSEVFDNGKLKYKFT